MGQIWNIGFVIKELQTVYTNKFAVFRYWLLNEILNFRKCQILGIAKFIAKIVYKLVCKRIDKF